MPGFPVDTVTCDFAVPGAAEPLVADRPDVIFHLAAIVSGEAELDFDKGYRINLDGTRMLLDAIRLIGGGYKPRIVFTSSIAVFGAPFPDAIGDEFFHTPLLSYGTQKAIGELLLADYSRRGFMDGIGIRLPTICIRPGLPNKAASGFFSNILREPLAGKEAVLPVSEDVRHWHASPRSAVGFLLHAATMDSADRRRAPQPHHARPVGHRRRADRGAEAGGGRQGGGADQARARSVHHGHRRAAGRAISTPKRARQLGFTTAEKTFDDIIRIHIEDELGGKFVASSLRHCERSEAIHSFFVGEMDCFAALAMTA